MNFFKIKTSWSNAELIPLKLCIATAYILVGAYFHNFFRKYYIIILIVFFITVIWAVYLWLNKMKKEIKVK
jgi:preprotein translocase subunit SecG